MVESTEVGMELEPSGQYAALEENLAGTECEAPSSERPQAAEGGSLSKRDSSGEASCRICMEGEESGRLISPCECSGSVSLIHTRCLEQLVSWMLRLCSKRQILKRSKDVCAVFFRLLLTLFLECSPTCENLAGG